MKVLLQHLIDSSCPACGHHVAVNFFDGGSQPLATLGWPDTAQKARDMARLPLTFVRCVECGHIYNTDFQYQDVPYSNHPNLMFNNSHHWSQHLEHVCDLVLNHVPEKPVIVEIGCGTGNLLAAMAEKCPQGTFVGFDPNIAAGSASPAIVARHELFDPTVHLEEYRPHLVMSRHVLEHLSNPLGFVQRLSFAAEWLTLPTKLFLEVPCVDPVFAGTRTNDFYYEHNSHFTVNSFTKMLKRCVSRIHQVETAYNSEVVYGIVTVGDQEDRVSFARQALAFYEQAKAKRDNIRKQIDMLTRQGKTIAIWGGTGKGAAFINSLGLDASLVPLVVDSDPDKTDTHVPGAGQRIRFRDYLIDHPVDIIIIPTQWRAADIVEEIDRCGVSFQAILIEHAGQLVKFLEEEHPYRHQKQVSLGSTFINL